MPKAEARIPTHRAGRYLTQLCRHTAQVGALGDKRRHRQQHGAARAAAASIPRYSECSDAVGLIVFDSGRCTLRATSDELILRAEADDLQNLDHIKEALTTRVQRIGHRDQLTVTWRSASAELSEPDRTAGGDPKGS